MRCYNRLYVGEKAKKVRFGILQGLRERKLQPEVYVITPPQNGNNVLDIYPSAMLLLPPYREQELEVVGIAVTYWEALEVARQIVDEMYHKIGMFSWRQFAGEKEMVPEERIG